MAKRLTLLLLTLVVCLPAWARERVWGYCEQGGYQVAIGPGTSVVQTTGAATYWQQSFPSCTVTVYATGTQNLIAIYADNSGTVKANPFTAATDGYWFFYADNQVVDVRFSGGGISSPFTRSAITVNDGTGGGGGTSSLWVNVMTDCGAIGNNVADDGPTIQTCINNHPGKTIYFPTTGTSVSGGGPLTNPSYYSSVTLTMSGNNQRLTGDSGGEWSGGTAIRFAAATTGIIIPSTCYSCKVERLELQSPDLAATVANGIYVQGGHAQLSNLVVNSFGKNAIEIDGATSNASSWHAYNIFMNACHTRCWYAHGTDANAGTAIGLNAISGGSSAIEDAAAYPNVYIGSQTNIGPTSPYKDSNSSGAIWIGSYEEGSQPASPMNGMVFGGNMTVDTSTGTPRLWSIGNARGITAGSQTYLEVFNQKDTAQTVFLRAGATADQQDDLVFATYLGAAKARLRWYPAGPYFGIYDDVYGGLRMRIWSGNNQNTELEASGNGTLMFNYTDGTGCVKIGNGASALIYNFCPTLATFLEPITTNSQITSTLATGTAPFVVASTTNVANLNASSLNGATFAAPGAIGGGTPNTGAFTTLSATGQVTSTLATGTAPFSIASTTPVANLTTVPTTYNAAGTQQTAVHIVEGQCTLGTNCAVTFVGAAQFTNATSYACSVADETGANAARVAKTNGTAITITGTGTDVIDYICIGN